jgi:hypothetical protein
MNLTKRGIFPHKKTMGFLSPKIYHEKASVRAYKPDYKREISKDDSRTSLIDNRSISQSFNSNILKMNMKTHSFKRAETELRKILNKYDNQHKTQINRTVKSLSKTAKVCKVKRYSRVTDSSLSPEEADLIMDEYRSIQKPKVWTSIVKNYRANPKQLMDLIPISLSAKKTQASATLKSKNSATPTQKNEKFLTSAIDPPEIQKKLSKYNNLKIPYHVETLKNKTWKITDDWARSLLNHNIKYNSLDFGTNLYTEQELELLIKKLPTTEENLKEVHRKCLNTLERLLMELLATNQDFVKFQNAYKKSTPSVLRSLINNCLNLYTLRKDTSEILISIKKREKMIKNLDSASKKDVIHIHEISKAIRTKIHNWLACERVPFSSFMYKGRDYINKMNEDLITLQRALHTKSEIR